MARRPRRRPLATNGLHRGAMLLGVEIDARAERAAGAAQYDDAHVRRALDARDRVAELAHPFGIAGIQHARPIERDACERTLDVEPDATHARESGAAPT